MSRNSKKNRELAFFNRFKQSLAELRPFEMIQRENPDFLLTGKNRKIGLELTELFIGSGMPVPLRARETLEDSILISAKRRYEELNHVPLLVNVAFRDLRRVNKNKAKQIGDVIGNSIHDKILQGELTGRLNQSDLPKEVKGVIFVRLKLNSSPVWGSLRTGWQPPIDTDSIQSALTRKASRVKEYLKCCDEIWLLIGIEGFQPSTWYEIEGEALKHVYNSEFDRVYVLDFQNTKSYLLRRSS